MSDAHASPRSIEFSPQRGLDFFLAVSEKLKETGYDMAAGQKPVFAVTVCSDSRQDTSVAVGLVPLGAETGVVATALGNVLKFANPGAFITGPDGKVEVPAGKWLELSKHYGIKDVLLVQHSGCGQMNVIHTYNAAEGGKDAIKDGFGPFFAGDAEQRASLVNAVKKNGLAHYEAKGIPLVGSNADKEQQAMAIEQLLRDVAAVSALAAADPKHYPTASGMYQHIKTGQFFMLDNKDGLFAEVKPSAPTRSPTAAHACGCGCGCPK